MMLIKPLNGFSMNMALKTKKKKNSLTLISQRNKGPTMMCLRSIEMPAWMTLKKLTGRWL